MRGRGAALAASALAGAFGGVATSCRAPPAPTAGVDRAGPAQAALTAASLRARIRSYADPRHERARPGTSGARELAERIAFDLAVSGCLPAGRDGRFVSPTPVVLRKIERTSARLELAGEGALSYAPLVYGRDFVARSLGAEAVDVPVSVEPPMTAPGAREFEVRARWLDDVVVEVPGEAGVRALVAPEVRAGAPGANGRLRVRSAARPDVVWRVRARTPGSGLRKVAVYAYAAPGWEGGGNGPVAGAGDAALAVEIMRALCTSPLPHPVIAEIALAPRGLVAAPPKHLPPALPPGPEVLAAVVIGSPQLLGWFAGAAPHLDLGATLAGDAEAIFARARAFFERFGIVWRPNPDHHGPDSVRAVPEGADGLALVDAYYRGRFATERDLPLDWYSFDAGARHAHAYLALILALQGEP